MNLSHECELGSIIRLKENVFISFCITSCSDFENRHIRRVRHRTTITASRQCDVILKDFSRNVIVAFFGRMLSCSALIGHRSDLCCHWLAGVAPVTASVRTVTSHPVSVLGVKRCIALLWLADTTAAYWLIFVLLFCHWLRYFWHAEIKIIYTKCLFFVSLFHVLLLG